MFLPLGLVKFFLLQPLVVLSERDLTHDLGAVLGQEQSLCRKLLEVALLAELLAVGHSFSYLGFRCLSWIPLESIPEEGI